LSGIWTDYLSLYTMNKAAPWLILLGSETLPDSRKLNSSKIDLFWDLPGNFSFLADISRWYGNVFKNRIYS